MNPESLDIDFPWTPQEDEAYRASERKWVRSWRGLPTRKEWNASPIHSDGVLCPHCGYRWHFMDIVQASGLCFNCNWIETDPNGHAKVWRQLDALAGKGAASEPSFVPLKDAKPKRFT